MPAPVPDKEQRPDGLVRLPDGRWAETDPTHCALGLRMTRFMRGWDPCRCGGHRYVRCEHEDHDHSVPDGEDRYRYRPPKTEACSPPRRMAPTGELEN